jgi:hypothetical protein
MYPTCVFSCREYDYEGITWSENNDIPKPSKEELTSEWEKRMAELPWEKLRKTRDELLEKTDKYATNDFPHASEEIKQAWLDYRKLLRDLPANTQDPENPIWPTPP